MAAEIKFSWMEIRLTKIFLKWLFKSKEIVIFENGGVCWLIVIIIALAVTRDWLSYLQVM